MALRECLNCGGYVERGRKCATCERERQRNRVRPHYAGDFDARAKQVRSTPGPCALCGQWVDVTVPAGQPLAPEAHHVRHGDPVSPLALTHRVCNQRESDGRSKRDHA